MIVCADLCSLPRGTSREMSDVGRDIAMPHEARDLTVPYDRCPWPASAKHDVNLRLLLGFTDGSEPAGA
jgi:hypothetical protein